MTHSNTKTIYQMLPSLCIVIHYWKMKMFWHTL